MNHTPMPIRPTEGLYDARFEHDACGVAFVAQLSGVPSHAIVAQGLTALENLDHRGATGADEAAGDGAGMLLQIPDRLIRETVPFDLPPAGEYAIGMAFLPPDARARAAAMRTIEYIAVEEGLSVVGWRDVPTRTDTLSPITLAAKPHLEQLVVADAAGAARGLDLDRLCYPLRKRAQHEAGVYFASLSSRTTVYKGMLTTQQLAEVFADLTDERIESALALVHSRFSTNTFPSWELAHPFRLLAHNGEINTIRGNRNWMRAREALLRTDVIPGELARTFPVVTPHHSDSASFDEVLELLHLGGRSLPHAVMMMIPEAWENNAAMEPKRRDFYRFHASLMEPWDGPAAVCFTDGTLMGATLDRNGLRPGRFWVTDDGLVVFASEAGVLDLPQHKIVQKGRLRPGRMLLVDLDAHRLIDDAEIKARLAEEAPYSEWLGRQLHMDDLPERAHVVHSHSSVLRRHQMFGYTHEEVKAIIAPMAETGAEAIGSMGTDTPIAVLSERPRLLFDYFSQLFAQVTNPPLDAIREEMVTSLSSTIGPEANLLEPGPDSCNQIVIPYPVLDSDELAKLVRINRDGSRPEFDSHVVRGLYHVHDGGEALANRLADICAEVADAIRGGKRTIVLSDRHSNTDEAPIPSLLLTAAVHQHLVREKLRTQAGLIVEAGDVREVHHMALLIGFGAAAVNPYLVFETAEDLARNELYLTVTPERAIYNVRKALGKGVLKIMSKMGVSTLASYTGAMIFEATGLSSAFIELYFTGTPSRIEGIGIDEIAEEIRQRHAWAHPSDHRRVAHRTLDIGGEYKWRREGPPHLFDPETVFRLQHATRTKRFDIFRQYTGRVNDQAKRLMTLRGLLDFDTAQRPPVPIDEVEPVSAIVKRFSTGAMSYGSISREAHETLARAMNRLGAKSNTGEGGEDPDRLYDPERRSAIKQVASGRFGVTSEYLANADDIQIKMAQGAKPGEGGQLPGQKVYPWVAKTRHSTPGVGLISPPPHHDIYSIEDLKQLIHDLKCANPLARVHVKLVAEVGVGTVAAGVTKAKADVVLISGHDGGTGAAPLTSVKHAGGPWELGLAETQQTLLLNGLRDRIVVQVDGQLKTGRDVVIGALLGAEEFGFATAPLVVSGCIMMRACHLDTCPVGVATQNPELREKFTGDPDFIVTFFEFIAQEVRELLASLGFRSLLEAVGHVELLKTQDAVDHWKAHGLDLSPILHRVDHDGPFHQITGQDHGLAGKLDNELIERSRPALERGERVRFGVGVRNVDRTVGTMLGHAVTVATRGVGLPEDTIEIDLAGTGGQSFGAFLPAGVTLRLTGDTNDYLGKGLSGGRLVVRPPADAPFAAEEQIIAGNVIAYGATGGELFVRGLVGERFCVRNSGAAAVVEGVGDHAAEYMTGGEALILGPTGRNVAAGMSGGVVWVLDLDLALLNTELADPVPLSDADLDRVTVLLTRHRDETGSPVAANLLAAGRDELARRLTKVLPRDYARVLAARADAEAAGLDSETTVKLMMEAAHG